MVTNGNSNNSNSQVGVGFLEMFFLTLQVKGKKALIELFSLSGFRVLANYINKRASGTGKEAIFFGKISRTSKVQSAEVCADLTKSIKVENEFRVKGSPARENFLNLLIKRFFFVNDDKGKD